MAEALKTFPNDSYAINWKNTIESESTARVQFSEYERAFAALDEHSCEVLKRKAISHFKGHRTGQLKQGFFHQLNEAFAFQYLSKRRVTDIRLLEEDGSKKPDIEFKRRGSLWHCEVKSIGISEDEIKRFGGGNSFDASCYLRLSKEFFAKLSRSLSVADQQIHAMDTKGLIFVVVRFDDFTSAHRQEYRNQLIEYLRDQNRNDVVVKAMLSGRSISAKSKLA